MKKYIFIFLVLNIIASTVSFAQRLNERGEKIVKSLSVHWYEEDGSYMESVSSDYSFQYDETGKLIGIMRKFKDEKNMFTEIFKKDGKQVTCKVLKNGKPIPKYGLELWADCEGKIELRKEIFPMYDEYEGVHLKGMRSTWYRQTRVELRGFELTDAECNDENIVYYGKKFVTPEEGKWGLREFYFVYVSDDGKIVNVDDYQTREYHLTSWNGDLYFYNVTSDSGLRDMLSRTVYSDKGNDTNINFYGFSDKHRNSPFRNAELLTEWGKYRSKHIVLREGYNEKFWEYKYDANNNISEIKIVDKYGLNRYCIVKLEYLY